MSEFKIYSPEDFVVHQAISLREQLAKKLESSIEAKTYTIDDRGEKHFTIHVTVHGDYSRDQLIDFQDWYAKVGKWKSITSTHKLGTDEIKFTLLS